jgi:7-carboxy-7-deazaguanine synthase
LSDLRPDVVAGKYDPSLFDSTGQQLLINEVFYSLQGEGLFTGTPTVFVRTAKCNLACKFCDTEFETYQKKHVWHVYEWALDAARAHGVMIGAGDPRPSVTLTGGEPALQNLGPLVHKLKMGGFRVHMETSGSVWSPWMADVDHVCVSPKVAYNRIPDALLAKAGEFKWVVNAAFLSMYERSPASVWHPSAPNFLQPESNNPKWIAAASKLILRTPSRYRMSLQTHKLMSMP